MSDLGWVVKDPLFSRLLLIRHYSFWNFVAQRGTHSVQHPIQPHFHLRKDLTLTWQPLPPPRLISVICIPEAGKRSNNLAAQDPACPGLHTFLSQQISWPPRTSTVVSFSLTPF